MGSLGEGRGLFQTIQGLFQTLQGLFQTLQGLFQTLQKTLAKPTEPSEPF